MQQQEFIRVNGKYGTLILTHSEYLRGLDRENNGVSGRVVGERDWAGVEAAERVASKEAYLNELNRVGKRYCARIKRKGKLTNQEAAYDMEHFWAGVEAAERVLKSKPLSKKDLLALTEAIL